LINYLDNMIESCLYLLKNKDIKTYQHSIKVKQCATDFSKYLKLPQKEQKIVGYAGALHDIGKLFIPDSILKKPSPLTDEEFTIIKMHPIFGYEMFCECFRNLNGKNVQLIGDAILHHHEHCDGNGYPDGVLINTLSPITSIISICDVYEALVSNRCYKSAYSTDEALKIMDMEKDKQFQLKLFEKFFDFVQGRNYYLQKKSGDA